MLFSVHKIFDERNKKIRKVGSVLFLVAICETYNFWKNCNQYEKKVPQKPLFSRKEEQPTTR